jgi:hypothetical protein
VHPAVPRAMGIIKVRMAIAVFREAFNFIFSSFSTADYQKMLRFL